MTDPVTLRKGRCRVAARLALACRAHEHPTWYTNPVLWRKPTQSPATSPPPARPPARVPADLVVESLLYDTTIYIFNLFIVFQDRSVGDMIVDVLALEFFTTIDDEFKVALLKFDSSFLEDMVVEAAADGCYAGPTSSMEDGRCADLVHGKNDEREGSCAAVVGKVVVGPLEATLHGIRTICRVVGPVFAGVMIVYGPYCLGMPEG